MNERPPLKRTLKPAIILTVVLLRSLLTLCAADSTKVKVIDKLNRIDPKTVIVRDAQAKI